MLNEFLQPYVEHKILNAEQYLKNKILQLENKKIVFTNGVFDILHLGHLSYLSQAKSMGDKLVIGLNSDSSTKSLAKNKDKNRPINSQNNRAIMLASLCMVDYVIIFEESTPINLLCKIKPDIYVKGGDYTIEILPETKYMQSWGGEVKILCFINGYSTTSIINKIVSQ